MATRALADDRSIVLPGGTLEVAVRAAAWPLDALCAFAARDNPRRGFLVVSKVLGRHIAATPRLMSASFDALAARLAADLPGPVVFVGMAETAIALGLGVHAAYRDRTGRTDTLALHTTRQQIDAEVIATFDEPHSHASAHLIYCPTTPDHRALLASARTLVIVDDEASTGTTLRNLARALGPSMPKLTSIRALVLADWCGDANWLSDLPVRGEMASLLSGRLTWRTAAVALARTTAPVAAGALGRLDAHVNFGRLGVHHDPVVALPDLAPGQPVLVLGTGEFTWPPFLLARALAARGHAVTMQATTRSPVHVGGAIGSALRFNDNYATDVPNFLYNVAHVPGRAVLIAHETPRGSVDPALVAALDASCVLFGA